ncbi:hypothetical protein CANARDRAFT_27393 [[Candida] arabinofermentans NRRL YB-2248]|uniref:Lariat debranching enzyme C-terminal domain-containing protein n=1 Tax=[Candida] arabinofermentans NRRL YB-2248 TaxID=983967 RepID=A0A1E4T2Z3_9ASCO|nr:hypothetical protein CANARDRAFT_27393 [[Candida] arabinofermentans NRRL YB-2248]
MSQLSSKLKVAIEGCCHGELNLIYSRIPKDVSLLIICGDFQSLRNEADLNCLAVPPKYKQMGDFHEYYSGKRKAPIPTLFIGGNHEASNYLTELKHGGFVAPNIYYLGKTGVVWFRGLRISGISGIYNEHNFMKLNQERFPYMGSALRSIYHYRKDDYLRLRMLKPAVKGSLFVSHDWPEGIHNYGSLNYLLNKKPFFKTDIQKGELGSVPLRELMSYLQPEYWFSAHLHVRFKASVTWDNNNNNNKKRTVNEVKDTNQMKKAKVDQMQVNNTDEIELDLDEDDECDTKLVNKDEIQLDLDLESDKDEKIQDEVVDSKNESIKNADEIALDLSESESDTEGDVKSVDVNSKPITTQFLALDKCLPKRQFLEFIDILPTEKNHISVKSPECLYLDPEYICSLKVIESNKHKLEHLSYSQILSPPQELVAELQSEVSYQMEKFKNLDVEEYDRLFKVKSSNFQQTASPHTNRLLEYKNPQTLDFEKRFGL